MIEDMQKLKVLELFAGIGAYSKALDRIGIEHEIVDAVDTDKYAITSFNAIHGTNFGVQDITTWDKDLEVDMIMHGSPCQDFSVAGKQAGGDVGSGTRSSLMYETIRIVGKLRPKYVIWENVKNLLSKKHKHNFDAYIETMNILGYNSYYKVLNAKDYSIPQNRERIYTISIRKDVDTDGYIFPDKEELKLRLKDMLEDEVDEKYYLSTKMKNYVLDMNDTQEGTAWEGRADNDTLNSNVAHTLGVRSASGNQRAGVSNFVVDNLEDEVTVKDFKDKLNSEIITYEVPQLVSVRKYPVDIEKLKQVLKSAKKESKLSNLDIAEELNVTLTTVEHWFRNDKYFSIPDADIWHKLKSLLNITTDELDESIMTFEEKEGVYEKSNRFYSDQGLSPTITTTDEVKILNDTSSIQLNGTLEGNCVNYKGKEVELPVAVASRGRNPENPSSRVPGEYLEQTLEFNTQGTSNCISTVQKDNYIMEPCALRLERNEYGKKVRKEYEAGTLKGKIGDMRDYAPRPDGISNTLTTILKDNYIVEPDIDSFVEENNRNAKHQQDLLQTAEGVCRTIPAGTHASTPHLLKTVITNESTECINNQVNGLRIRRLTPKECWRLMGFDDEDFEKAKKLLNDTYHKGKDMSNSQLYKQAGNSIVVNVLEKIFKNLFKEN